MAYRKKTSTDRVPPEVAFAFQHGKLAYRVHPGFDEASDEATACYLICGILINHPEKARQLWTRYRSDLLKRKGIQSWWAFKEYESSSPPSNGVAVRRKAG